MTIPRNLRLSPSGPSEAVEVDSDDVINVSTVPEPTFTSALDHLYERKIHYFDLEDDPVALYQFNDTTDAIRGPNLDLPNTTGEWGFTNGYPGTRSLILNIGARLQFLPDASLRLLGAMSVEVMYGLNGIPLTWLAGVGGTDGTGLAADNVTWGLGFVSSVTPRNATYYWERLNNTAVAFTTSTTPGTVGMPSIHTIVTAGFNRSASGVVTGFLNGKQFGPSSSALALPTGGGNGVLSIGGQRGTTSNQNFTFFSLALYDRVRSASEWLSSYNRSLGEGLGFLT